MILHSCKHINRKFIKRSEASLAPEHFSDVPKCFFMVNDVLFYKLSERLFLETLYSVQVREKNFQVRPMALQSLA